MTLGKPDAGKPPVRFDEGRSKTVIGRGPLNPSAPPTLLDRRKPDLAQSGFGRRKMDWWGCYFKPGAAWRRLSVAGRNRHGKIAANGTRQIFFDFVVTGNGFLATSLRIAPNGMAAALTNRQATLCLKAAGLCPAFMPTAGTRPGSCLRRGQCFPSCKGLSDLPAE